jgi:hypothetical protein
LQAGEYGAQGLADRSNPDGQGLPEIVEKALLNVGQVWHRATMDLPLRIIIAFSIVGVGVAIGVPVLIMTMKRRRRDKRRRRGIKDYNSPNNGTARS